ncbi:hypothetical protein, partial [Serratia silvae]
YILFIFIAAWQLLPTLVLAEAHLSCDLDPRSTINLHQPFEQMIQSAAYYTRETDTCWKNTEGETECSYKDYVNIPNRVFSTSIQTSVTCINSGDKSTKVSYEFQPTFTLSAINTVTTWSNLTMTVSGLSRQKTISNIEKMDIDNNVTWLDETVAPCKKGCESFETAIPRYAKNITITLSIRPILRKFPAGKEVGYDLMNTLGTFGVKADTNEPGWTQGFDYLEICGLLTDKCYSSGGSVRPPPDRPKPLKCTLTVKTPDTVTFQPISSDDLSRNRVRVEDFTLTAIKGPEQSSLCLGSIYNLPGKIKTEGGYSINSTFWGINHSSGAAQGIGLRLYDLDKGTYLQFNHEYTGFIKDISSISESKRIRAEISATTQDIKKIKGGQYSQVLTFEVKMP